MCSYLIGDFSICFIHRNRLVFFFRMPFELCVRNIDVFLSLKRNSNSLSPPLLPHLSIALIARSRPTSRFTWCLISIDIKTVLPSTTSHTQFNPKIYPFIRNTLRCMLLPNSVRWPTTFVLCVGVWCARLAIVYRPSIHTQRPNTRTHRQSG